LEKIFYLLAKTAYAADVNPIAPEKVPFTNLGDILATGIQIALLVAGLMVFAFLLIAGIQFISSGGDKQQAQQAKDKITAAILGLIIIVSAYAIAMIIEKVFGISIVSGITFPAAPNRIGQ
jgi:hypothetical protein